MEKYTGPEKGWTRHAHWPKMVSKVIFPYNYLFLARHLKKSKVMTNLPTNRNVFQRKTDILPPVHSHLYFSASSAFPPIYFIVQLFSLSFKFDLCKHECLKSFCLIINSACHNYICIKVLLLSTHWLWKNNLFKVKISLSPTMTMKIGSRSYKYNQHLS